MSIKFPFRKGLAKPLLALLMLSFISVPVISQAPADSNKVKNWDISAFLMAVFTPDNSFIVPIAYINYKNWHFEPRYNYENLETFSLFAGYNFRGGKKVEYLFTPMLGGVVGQTNGVAPGLEFDLALGKFGIYSEMEYVFDLDASSDSYFYAWSQLRYAPTGWMILGLVGNRNRVYQNDLDVQRGVSLGFVKGKNTLTGYYYNPFTPENYGSISFLRKF